MFYFTSRRVSVGAIFVWSAAVLVCTQPAGATPIESRLAEIISANHGTDKSGCNVHACKVVQPNNEQPDQSVAAPIASATPDATPLKGSSDTKTDPPTEEKPTPPAVNVAQTGAALGGISALSPAATWALAGITGVAVVLF